MKKTRKENQKELLFMTPIDKSMTVDEIYLKLIKLLEKNGVKVKDKSLIHILIRCYF